MDAKLFRLPTNPNFYAAIGTSAPFRVEQAQEQRATEDSRFPGYAAPMSDGRLVTSYKNHCSRNITAGKQYPTKEWMTKNASEIIQVSRNRFAEQTGAIYGTDSSVVPPPAGIVTCTKSDCTRLPTNELHGIGIERGGSSAPELFGTWNSTNPMARPPKPHTALTSRYEGGRNTPRGSLGPIMA